MTGLRGKDLEVKDGTMVIRYRRMGGKFTAREVSDSAAYEALRDYLEAAGRANVLGTGRPLWTSHDQAGVLGAPPTPRAFVENLKGYAREAGLSHARLHQTATPTRGSSPRKRRASLRRRRRSTTTTRRPPESTSRGSRRRRTGTAARPRGG